MTIKTLNDRLESIKLLMEYAVPEKHKKEALSFVKKHEGDTVALNIFYTFYSYLPEAADDYIKILRLLARKEGAFLICATTELGDYLYLATSERAELLGRLDEGIADQEILEFFGFESREAFKKAHSDLSRFPVYVPTHLHQELCPVCHAAEGEYHTLGCPIEVCPWCGGQLTGCDCRFTQLGVSELDEERQLDALLARLNKKGRIPFDAASQKPSYPSAPPQEPGVKDN